MSCGPAPASNPRTRRVSQGSTLRLFFRYHHLHVAEGEQRVELEAHGRALEGVGVEAVAGVQHRVEHVLEVVRALQLRRRLAQRGGVLLQLANAALELRLVDGRLRFQPRPGSVARKVQSPDLPETTFRRQPSGV
eukprot:1180883-Prorocentrum_minimum.AAC.3